MNKRGAGVVFLSIGLLLIVAREVLRFYVAAMLTQRVSSIGTGMLEEWEASYVPQPYSLTIAIIFIIIGIVYLLWSIIDGLKKTVSS